LGHRLADPYDDGEGEDREHAVSSQGQVGRAGSDSTPISTSTATNSTHGGRLLAVAELAGLAAEFGVAGAAGVAGADGVEFVGDALLRRSDIAVSLDDGSGRAGPPARGGTIIGPRCRGCRAQR
ncbi:hypothetical protein IC580_20700, partial [Cupriavidus sp. ISTL7]